MKIRILPVNVSFDTTNLRKCMPILKATSFFVCCMFLSFSAFAQTTITVTTAIDSHYNPGTPGVYSFRGAIEYAEGKGLTGGPWTINVPANTYNLSLGQIAFGAHAENISIVGAGAATTIVNMTTTNQDRFFVLNPTGYAVGNIVTSVTGIKFTNGLEKTDNYGGGAIQGGCATCTLNLTSCVFEGNSTGTGAAQSGASGGAINFASGGTLTINQCVFNGNTSPRPSGGASSGFGGAVTYYQYSYADSLGNVVNPNGVLTVTNCTFYKNVSGTSGTGTGYGGDGGALTIQGGISVGGQTIVVNVLENNFLNNSALGSGDGTAGAGARGGAISVSLIGVTPTISYNRFSNNTAASGKGNALVTYNGTVTATNNWWGCNNGPNTSGGCTDNAIALSGTLNSTPYLQLKTAYSSTALCPTGTTTLTEGFTSNSAGSAIAASNLTAFQDSTITFTGALGAISNQTTINNGVATATYTAGSTAGAGSAYARFDNVPANDAATVVSITIRATTAIGTNPGTSTVCTGGTASLSVAATGSGISYQWRRGTTNLSNGATGTGSTIAGATSSTLTITTTGVSDAGTNYNVVVSGDCGSATSTNGSVVVGVPGTWLGATSAAWSNTANWGCGILPTAATDVTIPSGTSFSPQIDITTAVANNVTINNGAALSFTGTTNVLSVSGSITNNGTFTPSSGKIVFAGATQTIPGTTYKDLQMNGAGSKTLAGAATVTGTLTLSTGLILLGANDLTISSSGTVSTGSSSSYIVTNSTGSLIQQNIGTSGRTGGITYPVGSSSTSFTPVILTNTGVADAYTVNVLNTVNSSYNTSDVPTGTVQSSNAVGRTWLIKEATAGGSNVSLTFQWNAADELTSFNRALCNVSHYYSGFWHPSTNSAASGSNPYTRTLTGVLNLSPFGVASANSILPLTLLSFTGNINTNVKQLNWTTTAEKNTAYFVVEKSGNGVDFDGIATLPATGNNSTGTNTYNYNDATGSAAIYYYRLKMVDKDGTSTYSNIVSINNLSVSGFMVKVTPNPFQSQLVINVDALQDAQLTFELVDMSGKKLMTQNKTVTQGNNTITINQLDNVTHGTYMLHYFNNSINQTIKLIKIK